MHLTRSNVSKLIKLERVKGRKWLTTALPGTHSRDRAIPINILFRETMKIVKTTRETKLMIKKKSFMVNKRYIKDVKFPVGLFDIIEFPELKENYRVTILEDKKWGVKPVKSEECHLRPCKIVGKKLQNKGVLQINLDNGFNILTNDQNISVGDTLVLDLTTKKIVKPVKLERGANVMLIDGKYLGKVGILSEIKPGIIRKRNVLLQVGKELIETSGRYVFVLDNTLTY